MRPTTALMRIAWLCVGLPAMLACTGGASAEAPISAADRAFPGDVELPTELARRLDAARAAKGADYLPRTHHLREDGSARFTNRLILESSPYLLQHAHNPVNWYPWGDEAFADAKRLGRPLLLSIGYSTCHWCHVMEEESFEDLEIAAYLNANYIAIKVDREERPDLDGIYMSAVQMLTGRGGWPMTTWLNPDGEAFFGGTYFPARDGDRGQRTGFLTLLQQLKQTYDEHPEAVAQKATKITEHIRKNMQAPTAGAPPGVAVLDSVVERLKGAYDPVHGGRKGRPKFPSSLPLRLLLGQYRRTGDERLREMAELTLAKMAGGGMYDQVGGGFHRYSTDESWLVPHFEKMLYDNALLAVAYLEGWQVTGREAFAEVSRDILRYVAREMTSPEGAFYSATDADSLRPDGEMEEGWFFTWTPAELEELLGKRDAARVAAYYDVSPRGNFEGRSILHTPRPKAEVARLLGIDVDTLEQTLLKTRERMYDERATRPAPLRDDKVLTSWNGLMISAMARVGFALEEPDFVERATGAAQFVLERLRVEGRLRRTYKDGQARHNAYLDDYAFLVAGLLDLYEASFEPRWLGEAVALQEVLDRHYQDSKNGGYFMTSGDHEQLLARERPAYDGAEPAGNSIALMNLLRLHELTSDDRYRATADRLLAGFAGRIRRGPAALAELLLALDFRLGTPREIVIVTRASTEEAAPFLELLRQTFLPNKVVVVVQEKAADLDAHRSLIPLIRGKVARKGRPTAYVCEGGVCQLPTSDVEVFREQLLRRSSSTVPSTASP